MLRSSDYNSHVGRLVETRTKRLGRNNPQLYIQCRPARTQFSVKKHKQHVNFPNIKHTQVEHANSLLPNIYQETVSVPGLEKILKSPYRWRKLMWVCAMVSFYGLCIFQLVDRLNAYFKYPVALDVNVEKLKVIPFPSISICPFEDWGMYDIIANLCYKKKVMTWPCRIIEDLNTTLENIWKKQAINPMRIYKYASCAKKNATDNCDSFAATTQRTFYSVYGTCVTYSLESRLNYRGAQTFFSIAISKTYDGLQRNEDDSQQETTKLLKNFHKDDNNATDLRNGTGKEIHFANSITSTGEQSNINEDIFPNEEENAQEKPNGNHTRNKVEEDQTEEPEESDIMSGGMIDVDNEDTYFKGSDILFMPHGNTILPEHDVFLMNHRVRDGLQVDVRFNLKKMHFLNTFGSPCVEDHVSLKCSADCITKHLDDRLKCRLPFMTNSTLPTCNTLGDVHASIWDAKNAYTEYEGCNCPRQCHEKLIEYSYDNYVPNDRYAIVFTLRCPNNLVDVVREKYTYALSSLVSDVGGSLGFCVGLCLFSFIEVLECVLQKIVLFCYNCVKSGKTSKISRKVPNNFHHGFQTQSVYHKVMTLQGTQIKNGHKLKQYLYSPAVNPSP